MKKIIAIAAVAVALAATPAFAAKDGKLSKNDSVGKVDITAVIPPMVRISGLQDMKIIVAPADLANGHRQDSETKFCVYSNIGVNGDYKVQVDGLASTDGSQGGFGLTGPGGTLNTNVWITDSATNSFTGSDGGGYEYPGQSHTYKTTADGQTRPATIDCSDIGGANSTLHAGINAAQILAIQSGKYSGTLTVTVSTL